MAEVGRWICMHGGLPRKRSYPEMLSGCPMTWLIYRFTQGRCSRDLELTGENTVSFLARREGFYLKDRKVELLS